VSSNNALASGKLDIGGRAWKLSRAAVAARGSVIVGWSSGDAVLYLVEEGISND
jgi:hypothetical protein